MPMGPEAEKMRVAGDFILAKSRPKAYNRRAGKIKRHIHSQKERKKDAREEGLDLNQKCKWYGKIRWNFFAYFLPKKVDPFLRGSRFQSEPGRRPQRVESSRISASHNQGHSCPLCVWAHTSTHMHAHTYTPPFLCPLSSSSISTHSYYPLRMVFESYS